MSITISINPGDDDNVKEQLKAQLLQYLKDAQQAGQNYWEAADAWMEAAIDAGGDRYQSFGLKNDVVDPVYAAFCAAQGPEMG